MKTRIFTLLFAVMAGMVTMNAEIYYGTCGANGDGSNILWTFNIETGALVLKGTGKMADYSDHTSVPWYEYRLFIESLELKSGITNIGVNAFYECKNLTSVILPEGLLSIGEAAFVMCVNLTEISLPNSLTTIERGAFNYCNSLTSMYIPANVSSIAPDAFLVSIVYDVSSRLPFIKTNFTHIDVDPANMYFASKDGVMYNKQMTKLIAYPAGKEGKFVVPNGVQEIGPVVFYGNMSLTEIEIPLSVTTIGEWAFGSCANLKSLTLPSSIKEIGAYAIGVVLPFITCEAVNPPTVLQSELYGSSLGFGNLYDEHNNPISQILYVPANSVEAYKAAEGWKDIPNILPIPDTEPCNTISGTCGAEGDNLTWELTCDGVLTISGSGAMLDMTMNQQPWQQYQSLIVNAIIEEGVTSIGDYAFYNCTKLTSVTIGNSVTSIGEDAFDGCRGLTSFDIPNSVISIGDAAFGTCCSLASVTIGNKVKEIGIGAFAFCVLENIVIPEQVKVIGTGAFSGNYIPDKNKDYGYYDPLYDENGKIQWTIKTITCYRKNPPQITEEHGIVSLCGPEFPYSSTILYVPAGSVETYEENEVWGDFDVRPIEAIGIEVTDLQVTSSGNSVDVTWPAVSGAATYELVIKDKNGNIICTLIFNSNGQLTQIAFNAPSYDGAPQRTQTAGFSFTVTGLDSGTSYDLTMTSKDAIGQVIEEQTISFTTGANIPTGFEDVQSDQVRSTKVLRDGYIYLLRGEHVYDAQGKMIK